MLRDLFKNSLPHEGPGDLPLEPWLIGVLGVGVGDLLLRITRSFWAQPNFSDSGSLLKPAD